MNKRQREKKKTIETNQFNVIMLVNNAIELKEEKRNKTK